MDGTPDITSCARHETVLIATKAAKPVVHVTCGFSSRSCKRLRPSCVWEQGGETRGGGAGVAEPGQPARKSHPPFRPQLLSVHAVIMYNKGAIAYRGHPRKNSCRLPSHGRASNMFTFRDVTLSLCSLVRTSSSCASIAALAMLPVLRTTRHPNVLQAFISYSPINKSV